MAIKLRVQAMKPWRPKYLLLIASILLVYCAMSSSLAYAKTRASLTLGLTPFSTSPSAFPQAFSGMGVMAGGAAYIYGDQGISFWMWNSGTGSVFALSHRMFLIGEPQSKPMDPDGTPTDKEKNPMIFKKKGWGMYAEGGLCFYSASLLKSTEGSQVTSGIGLSVALGFEYPVLTRFAAVTQLGMVNAIVNKVNSVYGVLALSWSFSI